MCNRKFVNEQYAPDVQGGGVRPSKVVFIGLALLRDIHYTVRVIRIYRYGRSARYGRTANAHVTMAAITTADSLYSR